MERNAYTPDERSCSCNWITFECLTKRLSSWSAGNIFSRRIRCKLEICYSCQNWFTCEIDDVRKTSAWLGVSTFNLNEGKNKRTVPDLPFWTIEFYFSSPKKTFESFHECIIIWGIIHRDPTNLEWTRCIKSQFEANSKHTLSVIPRRSVTKMNAWARCSPWWRPGTRWNPIRSERNLRVSCGPLTVSTVIPWIQWAV